jgi:hypothetical protein
MVMGLSPIEGLNGITGVSRSTVRIVHGYAGKRQSVLAGGCFACCVREIR